MLFNIKCNDLLLINDKNDFDVKKIKFNYI